MTIGWSLWVRAALGLSLGLVLGSVEARAQAVGAEAFGVYVKTLDAEQPKAPYAALRDTVMAQDEAVTLEVPGVVKAEDLFSVATGAGDTHDSSAQSHATLGKVDILNGVITADGVTALTSSAFHGTNAASDAEGANFANLIVNGVAIDPYVAPNTEIELPGVGKVILNEQIPSGDGSNDTGLTVNMIHVVLQDALTGRPTGEIIVGSASSYVTR